MSNKNKKTFKIEERKIMPSLNTNALKCGSVDAATPVQSGYTPSTEILSNT